jgi:EAL domain-containing protein (putative c-di-GMP-specific phosphodiesterase class I)
MSLSFLSSTSHAAQFPNSTASGRSDLQRCRRAAASSRSALFREAFDVAFTLAFQPIVDLRNNSVFAYEAMPQGLNGEGPSAITRHVTESNRFSFQDVCRTRSLLQASALGMQHRPAGLTLNISSRPADCPNACVERTLDLADKLHFPLSLLILEITPDMQSSGTSDYAYLNHLMQKFRGYGVRSALGRFGTGAAEIPMLAALDVDFLKLDRTLVRGIDQNLSNGIIVESLVQMAYRLDTEVIAEDVEAQGEYEMLARMGVFLMQGGLFAKPEVNRLPAWTVPSPDWNALQSRPGEAGSPCPPRLPHSHDPLC